MKWLPEHELELVRLFETKFDGVYLSHNLIGSMLNKSRPAVVGKVHRLKLTRDPLVPCKGVDGVIIDPQKVTNVRVPPTYGRSRAPAARPPPRLPRAVDVVHPPSPHAVSILELKETSCRFPIGHVGTEGFHLCGAEMGAQKPYCTAHAKLCYVPLRARREQWAIR